MNKWQPPTNFGAISKTSTLATIALDYIKTKLDPQYQRNGGLKKKSGWTMSNSIEYMQVLVNDGVENKVINAHVQDCLRYAENPLTGKGVDHESVKYFTEAANQGFEYTSIDGNNTASTINGYFNDEFKIYVGPTQGRGHRKKFFSELSPEKQMKIKYQISIDTVIYREIGIQEMCRKFKQINSAVTMLPQERRQATWTPLSKFIRNTANESSNLKTFEVFLGLKPTQIDKRAHEELMAKITYTFKQPEPSATGGEVLNYFYENEYDITPATQKKVKKNMKQMFELQKGAKGVALSTKLLSKGTFLSTLYIFDYLERSSYKVLDYDGFREWLLATAHYLQKTSPVTFKVSAKNDYLHYRRNYASQDNLKKLVNLFEDKLNSDLPDLENTKTISPIRTGSQAFSRQDKYELHNLQDGQDRAGREITLTDLHTSRIHADHVVSVKSGGQTELSNGELMFAQDNLQKGANSNQAHFDFQKK